MIVIRKQSVDQEYFFCFTSIARKVKMSATFKLAKQKQNDLRRLMNEQKSKQQVQTPTKKIDSPLAKYPFQLDLKFVVRNSILFFLN